MHTELQSLHKNDAQSFVGPVVDTVAALVNLFDLVKSDPDVHLTTSSAQPVGLSQAFLDPCLGAVDVSFGTVMRTPAGGSLPTVSDNALQIV